MGGWSEEEGGRSECHGSGSGAVAAVAAGSTHTYSPAKVKKER